jgi:hypothetical protein
MAKVKQLTAEYKAKMNAPQLTPEEKADAFRAVQLAKRMASPSSASQAGVLKALLISAPRAAFRLAAREILIYCYIKSIPFQARTKPKVGSIV